MQKADADDDKEQEEMGVVTPQTPARGHDQLHFDGQCDGTRYVATAPQEAGTCRTRRWQRRRKGTKPTHATFCRPHAIIVLQLNHVNQSVLPSTKCTGHILL